MEIIIDKTKCILIVEENLTAGQQANTAAVLAMTIGSKVDEIIGEDISDADSIFHTGITQLNIPVLVASSEKIRTIVETIRDNADIFHVDFTQTAQTSRSYQEYRSNMAETSEVDLRYIGIGLVGDKKRINKLSGNLKLLR